MKRHSKAQYSRLFDDPKALFGGDVEVILWPDGEPCIVLRAGGHSYTIEAHAGPAGFGLTLKSSELCDVFPSPNSAQQVTFHDLPGGAAVANLESVKEMELCQYGTGEHAQAYRRWYLGQGEYPGDSHILAPVATE